MPVALDEVEDFRTDVLKEIWTHQAPGGYFQNGVEDALPMRCMIVTVRFIGCRRRCWAMSTVLGTTGWMWIVMVSIRARVLPVITNAAVAVVGTLYVT
jgi:hypothetical protein